MIDHVGWGDGEAAKRTRGWSGKWAGFDSALLLDGDIKTGDVVVVPRRLKDGMDFTPIVFGSERVDLGVDNDGDPLVAFVAVERDAAPARPRPVEKAPKMTAAQRMFRDAFDNALLDHAFDHVVFGDGPRVRAVLVEHVRELFIRRRVTGEEDLKRQVNTAYQAFKRELEKLPVNVFGTERTAGGEVIWRARDDR